MNELCYLLSFHASFAVFHSLVEEELMMIDEYPEDIIIRIWRDDLILESICIREQELILDSLGCLDACL